MKDFEPTNKILGMQIHRDRKDRKLWLSQKNYLLKVLRCFNMQDYKPISTPLPINYKLSSSISPSNEAERMEISRVLYASMLRSLMYAMICTIPNIAQVVGVISRFMADLGREHESVVKRILRYIKRTSGVALCFEGSKFIVTGYVDSDFVGDHDKRESTSDYVFTLVKGTMSWLSESTIEVKCMATTCKEAIWIQRLLEKLGTSNKILLCIVTIKLPCILQEIQPFIQGKTT